MGTEARGLRAIPVRNAGGEPMVIRVASLVDDKPFPTLFWLVDPALNYRIDQLEAGGAIAELQARIDTKERCWSRWQKTTTLISPCAMP